MRTLTHDGGLSRAVLSLVEIAEVNLIELQKRGGLSLRFASVTRDWPQEPIVTGHEWPHMTHQPSIPPAQLSPPCCTLFHAYFVIGSVGSGNVFCHRFR